MMKRLNSQLARVCVTIVLLVVVNATVVVARPSNDDCSNAVQIGDVANMPFDTAGATFDGITRCMNGPNIWYCYTASCTGDVTVSLLGSSYDTMLAVYDGCICLPDILIECNDDFGGTRQSQITFAATAGRRYMIEVGGYGRTTTGQGLLTVSCGGAPPPPPPSKDDCANAQPVGEVTNLAFDTRDATFDGPGHCMTSPNIWYCYTASCTGDVTVSLLGSSFDTMLAVYKGCGCPPTSSNLIGCNDDFGGSQQSQLTFAATAGSQYLIEIGGYGSQTGQGVLTISCGGQAPPPSGDNCANALPVGDVTNLSFDTRDATFDGPGLCMTSPNIWYCYTASCTGNVTVALSNSSFDTMLAVYDGCGCYPASKDLIACDDDSGPGYHSRVSFAAIAGSQYLIEIGGFGSETGQGRMSIQCEPAATPQKSDLGDAPDSTNNFGRNMTAYPKGGSTGTRAYYPTVFDDGRSVGPYGPLHVNAQLVAYLGKKITAETEADTGPDEDGINNIRPTSNQPDNDGGDDAVVLPLKLPHCRWITFDYTVSVVKPGTDLWVNVWCDWNRDGDWDDTLECTRGPVPEWAVQNQFLFNLPEGLNQITSPAILSWHPKDGSKEIWMRITLSEQPWKGGSNPGTRGNGGSGPRAKYSIGETEDYYFVPDLSAAVCEDYNGDGVINTKDLVDFTAAWLENCPQ